MVNFTMQVRDRFRLTKQALESLAASSPDRYSVTVLDDRSQDETRDFVMAWCARYGARYIRNDEPLGTGQLRNMVMEESRYYFGQGDYVAPHDNDVFFKPLWLDTLIQCYEVAQTYRFRLMGAYGHPYHHPIAEIPIHFPQLIARNVFSPGRDLLSDQYTTRDMQVREVQALATQ